MLLVLGLHWKVYGTAVDVDGLSVVYVQVLGDRWAAICRWTEERWILLQEILLKWQHFTNEQVRVALQVYPFCR